MIGQNLETKTHNWPGLTEYHLDGEDVINKVEFGIEGIYKISKRLKPNQYFIAETITNKKLYDSNYLQKYIDKLREFGLNIGKGDAEYGYKMPLPENQKNFSRSLIIFRRRIAD